MFMEGNLGCPNGKTWSLRGNVGLPASFFSVPKVFVPDCGTPGRKSFGKCLSETPLSRPPARFLRKKSLICDIKLVKAFIACPGGGSTVTGGHARCW